MISSTSRSKRFAIASLLALDAEWGDSFKYACCAWRMCRTFEASRLAAPLITSLLSIKQFCEALPKGGGFLPHFRLFWCGSFQVGGKWGWFDRPGNDGQFWDTGHCLLLVGGQPFGSIPKAVPCESPTVLPGNCDYVKPRSVWVGRCMPSHIEVGLSVTINASSPALFRARFNWSASSLVS